MNEKKFTIIKLLELYGLDTSKKVAVLRHQVNNEDEITKNTIEIKDLYKKGLLEVYQSLQGRVKFECDFLIIFIADENTRAKFIGVYKVNKQIGLYKDNKDFIIRKFGEKALLFLKEYPSYRPDTDTVFDLEEIKDFNEFKNRIIVEWGKNGNYVKHWYNIVKGPEQDKEIIEILPAGYVAKEFTGFLDFYLDYDELKEIISNKDANKIWHTMLSSVFGIYLILDKKTGKQYVGSAYGQTEKGGILGRWSTYANNGHGDNKGLEELLEKEGIEYRKNFRFSILQTLPKTITPKEAFEQEVLYKDKLGTREFGYNKN